MAFSLYTQSFGVANANSKVIISEAGTGTPATILASASGGIVSDRGITQTDASGNISVYIDTARTWKVTLVDESYTSTFSGSLSSTEYSQFQSLVSGDWIPGAAAESSQSPTLYIASDSIAGQMLTSPSSAFGGTSAKGSYLDASSVRQVGVTNIYAENPARVKFRAAHNLVTGDQCVMTELAAAHPLASRRYTVTVTAADEVTLDGIDASAMAAFTSAGASTDALLGVDMAFGNAGYLSWALSELGYPFDRIDGCIRPGCTTAQLAAQIGTYLTSSYTHGVLHVGRNDGAWDAASTAVLRDAMLAKCGYVLVVLPWQDGSSGSPTSASLAKLKSIADYWYAQQATNPRIRVSDLFGAVSDPTATYEAALSWMLADGVHTRATGAAILGAKVAADWPPITRPRRALSRVSSGSANLLTGGRYTALTGGTIVGGVTGAAVAGWTIDRTNTNVSGGYAIGCVTPAVLRRHSTAYVAGDILDVRDGYWYVVKTAGTTASSVPAGYATATMYDWATGVTDGTAVVVRVPVFTASLDRCNWQLIDGRISADTSGEALSFLQSLSLPSGVAVGDFVRAQFDVINLSGFYRAQAVRMTISNSTPTVIARGFGNAINGLLSAGVSRLLGARTIRTPALRVPQGAATLEARLMTYLGPEGCQYAISAPVLEKVSAPGLVA